MRWQVAPGLLKSHDAHVASSTMAGGYAHYIMVTSSDIIILVIYWSILCWDTLPPHPNDISWAALLLGVCPLVIVA